MPIRSGHVTVTDVATRLDIFTPRTGAYGQSVEILVRNAGINPVAVGGAAVTFAAGYSVGGNGGTLSLGVTPPDGLWGICAAGLSSVCEVIMTNVQ
jgi:hypothetical protein